MLSLKNARCLLFGTFLFFPSIQLKALESKVLTIGSPLNSPPYVMEAEGRGIEIDLISSIIKKMGYVASWRYLPPKRIRHQVLQHEIHAGIRAFNFHADSLYYSRPYITFQNVAITTDPSIQLSSIKDLSKYSVVAFQNAKDFLGPDYTRAVAASTVYLELPNQAKQIETLFRHRSQVIILEKKIFHYFREMFYPRSEVKIFEIFPTTQYSVVFSDKNLRDEFDKVLQAQTHQLFGD